MSKDCGAVKILSRPGAVGVGLSQPGIAMLESAEELVSLIAMVLEAGREAFGMDPLANELHKLEDLLRGANTVKELVQ